MSKILLSKKGLVAFAMLLMLAFAFGCSTDTKNNADVVLGDLEKIVSTYEKQPAGQVKEAELRDAMTKFSADFSKMKTNFTEAQTKKFNDLMARLQVLMQRNAPAPAATPMN